MSGAEIFQVVGAAFELVRFSSEVIEFFRKVHNAKQAASDTYLRIKQLHRVAADVELALRRRSNQPGVSQKRLAQNERMIWKNTRVHLKRCHQILSLLRRELVGFDGEVEPGWLKRVGLQLKLELVQKERLARLHSQLDTQFQALQLNTQALNVFIQVDTHERIDETQEKIDERSTEIMSGIAKLTMMHQRGNHHLEVLSRSLASGQYRSMSIGETSTSTLIPQITIDRDDLNPIEQDAEQDVKLMDDTLKTAWDVISNYDPKGESLSVAQGRYDDADLDSASSDDEFEKNPLKVTETVQHRSPSLTPNSPNFPLASIYHDHQLPREALDRLVEMHQLEGKTRLKIDQPHRAEQELIKAIEYAHKRKEWYGVSFPSTLMQEDLAEIYKQQHKYDEALDVWLDLLPRTQDAPGPLTVDNCRHYYLVADTYYEKWRANQVPSQQSDLNRALKFALTAFKGRYSMRERDEALIHESAGLLVLIYTALSDTTAAAVYRSFMPTPVIEEEPAAVDDDGSPVLSLSSQRRFSLAEPSFDPNKDANLQLRDAIKTRHVPTVLALLQRPEIDLERVFKHGRTPLMYAFQRSKSESLAATTSIVDALLAAGAKIYAEDEEGRTVLHQAAARADADMIRLAIRKDAGLEARDKHRHTPLLVAVSENHRNAKAAVQTLLEHNADKAARDDSDWTVVHHAAHKSAKAASQPAYNHAADVLRLLLDQGANVDALARNKATPLCLVANIGDAATAEVLLNANANVNHRSAAGRSPLYLAVNNHGLTPEYEAVVKTLLAHKAEVDERILPARWKDFQHLQRVANAASAASAANVTSGAETAVGGGAARERGASVSHGMRRVSTATTTTTDRRDSTTDSASLSQVDSSGAGGSTTGGSVSSLGSALGRGLMSPRNWAKRKKSETSAVMPF